MKNNHVFRCIKETVREKKLLCVFLMFTVITSVATALLPPLVLERIVNAQSQFSRKDNGNFCL